MIQNIYMLYDNVSCMYVGALTILINDNVAMRSFADFIKNPQFPFSKMAKDLKLYRLGSINTEDGTITCEKDFVCDLSSLIDKE